MWHTVARWATGLLNGFPDFATIDDFPVMKESLRKVAALNLKKATGGEFADFSKISAYAWRDRDLLLQQFRLLSPEIVVACGTFDILVWLLELNVNPDNPWEKTLSRW
jgi:hypothetical protein